LTPYIAPYTRDVIPVKRRRTVVDDSALTTRIGQRIRVARLEAGLTQQQLADGRYTKAYISALEKGHAKPSLAALHHISARLRLPAAHFLRDADEHWSRLDADLLLARPGMGVDEAVMVVSNEMSRTRALIAARPYA